MNSHLKSDLMTIPIKSSGGASGGNMAFLSCGHLSFSILAKATENSGGKHEAYAFPLNIAGMMLSPLYLFRPLHTLLRSFAPFFLSLHLTLLH
jgi:hypothetical protein